MQIMVELWLHIKEKPCDLERVCRLPKAIFRYAPGNRSSVLSYNTV